MRLITWLLSIWLAPALGKFIVEAPAETAGSAPASETPAAPGNSDLAIPSGAEYDAWRMSGKLPTPKDDAAPSGESETPDTETPETNADTAAASAAATAAGKKGKTKEDTERRFRELSENFGAAQRRIAELERERTAPPKPATTPAPQPAAAAITEPEPKIDDVDAKGEPKYKTLNDYLAAARKWDRDTTLSEMEKRSYAKQQESARSEHLRVINESWKTKVEAARTKFADFDAVALNPDLKIIEGSVADAFVLDSEHGGEVLYHLGKNPAELEALSKLNPLRQARELFKIEAKFAKPAAAPAKKVTDAPRPPHEVNGGGRTAPDELEQAVKDGDEAAYFASANRRDVSRRKGK